MRKSIRILALVLTTLMLVTSFVGCKNEENNQDPQKQTQTTDDRKTLTVGFDAEFPPYGFEKDGEYVGFDLDLAAEVCSRRGWELKLQPIAWDSKDAELNSGAIDCIWNGFTIQGREDLYEWTEPYVNNSQVIVVKTDSEINTLADLADKIVSVQDDSSAQHALEDVEDSNKTANELNKTLKELSKVPDYNTSFLDLESGSVDAIAMDIGVAKFQIAERGDSFKILDEVIKEETYGVGFKLGNTELRDQVWESLVAMGDDGKFMEIAEKWELTDSVVLGK